MNLLIRNATVVQWHPPKVIEGTDVLIEKGLIARMGTAIGSTIREVRVLEARGRILMPGNVCAHNHFYATLARGIVARIPESHDFVGVLKNLWWRLDRALDRDSLFASGMVGALEAIRCGTTAVVDHHASPAFIRGSLKTLREAFDTCGLRGILCYEVTDRDGMEGRDEGLTENRDFIIQNESDRLRGAVGAHAPFTLSDQSLARLSEIVSETGRGIHLHVSEDAYEHSFSHHHYGISPLERLERFGLLDEKSLIVHGVHLLDKEIELLKTRRAFLVHNPRSNMNNQVGYNPRLLDLAGAALGTDGMGSDMFEESRFAYFRCREERRDLPPDRIVGILDCGNRILERYFGGSFGRVEPGYTADLLLLSEDPPTPLRVENLSAHFIFGLASRNVDTVIVGGNVIYENGRFPFDTEPFYGEARKQAARMWKELDAIDI